MCPTERSGCLPVHSVVREPLRRHLNVTPVRRRSVSLSLHLLKTHETETPSATCVRRTEARRHLTTVDRLGPRVHAFMAYDSVYTTVAPTVIVSDNGRKTPKSPSHWIWRATFTNIETHKENVLQLQ